MEDLKLESFLQNFCLSEEFSAEDCVKPGVNLKELDKDLNSSCGCNPDHPAICTDLKFKFVDTTWRCEASEDCQKAIHKIYDIWKEGAITNPICFVSFETCEYMSAMCVEKQS